MLTSNITKIYQICSSWMKIETSKSYPTNCMVYSSHEGTNPLKCFERRVSFHFFSFPFLCFVDTIFNKQLGILNSIYWFLYAFAIFTPDSLPETQGSTKWAKVCEVDFAGSCARSNFIKITNCGSFFVYELRPLDRCSSAYCFS